jgi:putative tricarboxylic transport membrane protein
MDNPMITRDTEQKRRHWLGPRLAALVVLGIGVVALSQAFAIRESAGYSVVGPRFFPIVVAVGLVLWGVAFLIRTTSLAPDDDLAEQAAAEEAATHWATVLTIMALLVIYVYALAPLGYALATALFFPVVARIMGSRNLLRDLLTGILLGLVIYIVFTRFLGVRLPAGLLAGIL